MSDELSEGEIWADHKQASKDKRKRNREYAAETLSKLRVDFESKNDGVHFIVNHPSCRVVDFWPGTGKWVARGVPRIKKRGIKSLLKYLGVE